MTYKKLRKLEILCSEFNTELLKCFEYFYISIYVNAFQNIFFFLA